MHKVVVWASGMWGRVVEGRERGSLAAVLGVAAVLAAVTLGLGAFAVGQVKSARVAEGQANMSAAFNEVTARISSELYRDGVTHVQANDFYDFPISSVGVVVKDVQLLPNTNLPGVQVVLEASWRQGQDSATETRFVPVPSEALPGESGVISGFDSNGFALWQ